MNMCLEFHFKTIEIKLENKDLKKETKEVYTNKLIEKAKIIHFSCSCKIAANLTLSLGCHRRQKVRKTNALLAVRNHWEQIVKNQLSDNIKSLIT